MSLCGDVQLAACNKLANGLDKFVKPSLILKKHMIVAIKRDDLSAGNATCNKFALSKWGH